MLSLFCTMRVSDMVSIVTESSCVFLGILMQMEESPYEDDVVTLEMKSDIQLILSALCETDMHRKVKLGFKTHS